MGVFTKDCLCGFGDVIGESSFSVVIIIWRIRVVMLKG